jgi:putative SOS response-associated peptidase YedK
MCDRYHRIEDKQAIAEYFHAKAAGDELLPPGYNLAPGTTQPVIRPARDTGSRELVPVSGFYVFRKPTRYRSASLRVSSQRKD